MTSPGEFTATFSGPDGEYSLTYTPDRDEGFIDVSIRGVEMRWNVFVVERGSGSTWMLEGLTQGTKSLWGDVYWFTLYRGDDARMEYYGDRVIWRTDRQA